MYRGFFTAAEGGFGQQENHGPRPRYRKKTEPPFERLPRSGLGCEYNSKLSSPDLRCLRTHCIIILIITTIMIGPDFMSSQPIARPLRLDEVVANRVRSLRFVSQIPRQLQAQSCSWRLTTSQSQAGEQSRDCTASTTRRGRKDGLPAYRCLLVLRAA